MDTTTPSSGTSDRATIVRNLTSRSLSEAFVELLEWDNNNEYPEVLVRQKTSTINNV